MDQSSTADRHTQAAASFAARRPGGMLAGIAISLLLHALLILIYRNSAPQPQFPVVDQAPRTTTVWLLRPAPPKPVAAPAAPKTPPLAQARPEPSAKPAKRRQEAVAPPRPARREAQPIHEKPAEEAIVAAPALPADPFAQPAAPASNGKFDINAARQAARQLAAEPELPDDAPLARLKAQQRQREIQERKLARDIAKTARPDCKDGLPGGLLAPLFLLMDKKDHGCKW